MKTTLAEQKVASSFVVQDAVRNVTIKPETTKRQDEVTGRLPRYTRYTSPRMKAQARVQDSAMSRQKNVLPEVYNLYKLDDMNIVRQELNLSVHRNQSVS